MEKYVCFACSYQRVVRVPYIVKNNVHPFVMEEYVCFVFPCLLNSKNFIHDLVQFILSLYSQLISDSS